MKLTVVQIGLMAGLLMMIVGLTLIDRQVRDTTGLEKSKEARLSEEWEAEELTIMPVSPTPGAAGITVTGTPTPTPALIPSPVTLSAEIRGWQYPGSKITAVTTTSMNLESSDKGQIITDWYINKAKAEKWLVSSRVLTSVNGRIENFLEFNSNKWGVTITMHQRSPDKIVEIMVELSTE